MSWIVQHLLKNKVQIRTLSDPSSDEYNDLLVLESKIAELRRKKLLTERDLSIIEAVSDGSPLSALEDSVGVTRLTIARSFENICERLAYTLGGYFTDDGFLENLRKEYKLSNEDLEKVKNQMFGRFKHKLIRKGKNEFTNF